MVDIIDNWGPWEIQGLETRTLSFTCVLVAQSCPTLCDPVDCGPPGSSVHEILQAGILGWVAIPFSRDPSHKSPHIFEINWPCLPDLRLHRQPDALSKGPPTVHGLWVQATVRPQPHQKLCLPQWLKQPWFKRNRWEDFQVFVSL